MNQTPAPHPERPLGHGQFFGQTAQKIEVDGFALALMEPDPLRVIERHTHETAHFILHLRGAYLSSARGAPRAAVTPTLIYNPPGTTHEDTYARVAGRAAGLFLSISVGAARLADTELRLIDHAKCLSGARPLAIGARLLREFHRRDASSPMAVEAMCLELFGELATLREREPRGTPAWFHRARELIRDGCNAPLTIRSVATECGVHPVYLARMFRHHGGEAPATYLRRCRIERAAALLAAGRTTLSETAIESGFVDQSHLTNVFRRRLAVTPGEFRSLLAGDRPAPGRKVSPVQDASDTARDVHSCDARSRL
jgi:AraC family transcriptional regulator